MLSNQREIIEQAKFTHSPLRKASEKQVKTTEDQDSNVSDPHRLLLNLSDEINLKRKDKYVVSSNRSICYTRKNIKKSYKK